MPYAAIPPTNPTRKSAMIAIARGSDGPLGMTEVLAAAGPIHARAVSGASGITIGSASLDTDDLLVHHGERERDGLLGTAIGALHLHDVHVDADRSVDGAAQVADGLGRPRLLSARLLDGCRARAEVCRRLELREAGRVAGEHRPDVGPRDR